MINNDTSEGQGKKSESPVGIEPWPPEHQAGALSALLPELMDHLTEFLLDKHPAYIARVSNVDVIVNN